MGSTLVPAVRVEDLLQWVASLSLIDPLGFAQNVASLWGVILTPVGWYPHVCRDVRLLVAVLS